MNSEKDELPYWLTSKQALAFVSLDPYVWAWKNANLLDKYYNDEEIPYFVRNILNSPADIVLLQNEIINNKKMFSELIKDVLWEVNNIEKS